jgi:hypothetical protein
VTKLPGSNSAPCSRCLAYLKKTGIRKIYYTYENGVIKMEKTNQMQSSHISSRFRKPFAEFESHSKPPRRNRAQKKLENEAYYNNFDCKINRDKCRNNNKRSESKT